MNRKILFFILFVLSFSFSIPVFAQLPLTKGWDATKIRGTQFLPHPSFIGFPFYNKTWIAGRIEFNNGTFIDSLYFRYSSYRDELIYFNKEISSQIIVDKASVKCFSYNDSIGNSHVFRRQYYEGYAKGNCFFEVLADADIDLLCLRRVRLLPVSPYKSVNDVLKDQAYKADYQFYLYSSDKGYSVVRPSLTGLLAKFSKDLKRPIKKELRKNRIRVVDEASFVLAWKCINESGFQPIFYAD